MEPSPPAVVELTILMPCLNEAETLAACISKANSFLERSGVVGEVLIADNGSTDGSQEIARSHGARVVDVPVKGYGSALYWGSRAALGKFIIMGDSDNSYDFSRLEPFLAELRKGADLVMGNRFAGGIRPGAMPLKNRYLGNPALSGIGRLLFRIPIRDFHCGLRGYNRAAFDRMELRTTGMEYASEMVIKASLLGMRIVEVPTTLDPDGRSRPPHLRPWRDGWRHLRFMLLHSPRWTFFYPGAALALFGSVGWLVLLRGPVDLGIVGLDVHTLLFASFAMMLGFQLMGFGLAAREFATVEGFLPESALVSAARKYFHLEVGLIIGAALLALGVAAAAASLYRWQQVDFGALDTHQTLRIVISSITTMGLGAQCVFTALLVSMLGLRRRRADVVDGWR